MRHEKGMLGGGSVVRTQFDQFARGLLEKALSTIGEVRAQVEILREAQAADVWFLPARACEWEPRASSRCWLPKPSVAKPRACVAWLRRSSITGSDPALTSRVAPLATARFRSEGRATSATAPRPPGHSPGEQQGPR